MSRFRQSEPSSNTRVYVRSARAATAVRTFTLSVATGLILSRGELPQTLSPLIALILLAVVCSALELSVLLTQGGPWLPVGEAFLIALILMSDLPDPSLLICLAAAPVGAGLRHGAVSSLNAAIASGLTIGFATLVYDSSMTTVPESLLWLVVGLGVGQLAGWQSKSMRELEDRQAPYAAGHALMSQLHDLARRGAVGLDAKLIAADLLNDIRGSTGHSDSAVFVLGEQRVIRLLSSAGDIEGLTPACPEHTHDDTVVRIEIGSAQGSLGAVVLRRMDGWTEASIAQCREVVDRYALRLDTALLFDDVRMLAAVEERNRIAREMHDGVAQEVAALGFLVDEIASVSGEASTRKLAIGVRDEISRVVTELRFSIFDLRHHVDDRRLSAALAEYVREVSRGNDLRVHLMLDESGPALPSRSEMELLRVAQEAIGNVRRHAHANNLWVTLVSDGTDVRLEVEDDGVGNAVAKDRHWGLQTMSERAASIGADLHISPRAEGGTVISLKTAQSTPLRRESLR